MEGQRALRMHQKYLNLCSDDERSSNGFGTTWGWVIITEFSFWGKITLWCCKAIFFKAIYCIKRYINKNDLKDENCRAGARLWSDAFLTAAFSLLSFLCWICLLLESKACSAYLHILNTTAEFYWLWTHRYVEYLLWVIQQHNSDGHQASRWHSRRFVSGLQSADPQSLWCP